MCIRDSLYERDGGFQLIVTELMLDGAGALGIAFERLKQALAAQGLFDTAKKRPIPPFPSTIGLVTSASGAALQDILSVAQRRNPSVSLILAPAAAVSYTHLSRRPKGSPAFSVLFQTSLPYHRAEARGGSRNERGNPSL